jgi:hypothetical protein
MQSFKSRRSCWKARVAGAAFGLVCSVASLSAVFAVFASASGELDPLLVKVKAAPSASEVAGKVPAKPVRS